MDKTDRIIASRVDAWREQRDRATARAVRRELKSRKYQELQRAGGGARERKRRRPNHPNNQG